MGDQLKLCLMQLDERTRKSISLVFKHRTGDSVLLSDEEAADLVVMDLDLKLGKSLDSFHAMRTRKPSVRAIGLSSSPDMQFADVLVIQKPISTGRLLEAIEKVTGKRLGLPKVKTAGIASSLGSRLAHDRRRPDSARGTEGKMSFDPNAYLLGTLMEAQTEAMQRDMTAIIRFYGNRVIAVEAGQKSVETNLTASQARVFALTAFDSNMESERSSSSSFPIPDIEYVRHEQARERISAQTTSQPWEHFMWNLGMMTSRGRLPEGLTMEEQVYLRRWPNMTGFSHTDNELRIIALWIKQPLSLYEIVETLGVTEQEVSCVYTAAYAAGLAGKANRQIDGIWERTEVKEHKERGIFSSIIKHLMQRKSPVVKREVA